MTSETVEVARIALRLPPFWKSNVRLWIAQCDHAFTFSGISSDDTKYSALVANLDAETLSYVSDIVLSPPNSDKYHTLSQRLITQSSDSETQKIKKLLTDLQLGDEKPSHLLRKMKELSNGQLQDDFLQSLWLQRMPPHIQTVLSASSEPLDKLAIIADKVSEVVGSSSTICAATTVPPPSQSSSCSVQPTMDSLARQIQELSLQVAELTRERNSSRHQRYSSDRRRSHSRSRSVNRGSGICYYHRRYKEQARKCVSPCAFVQKNDNPSLISKSASHGTVHHIITTGPPVTARPRRLHPKLYDAVKVEFEFLLAQGIIRLPKVSPWSSPLHVVPKSDSTRCKQALADAALLAHPSPSAPLALHVHASDYAIGGALHQVVDSELQPLAFFSRKLTSSKKSYSAYDRELLAIYSAIRHFRYMLEARDFTVFTDHKPLTYAFRQKVTSVLHGRSVSWISSLSSPQILYTFQDLAILLLMFSLVFLQSPSQVKLTMTVLLRHNRLIRSFTP
ncbi:transposon Ty3-I Gag-Pol polyprotein [Trichonephila clavipes]|nr:transposon Ty3-I Gag-Pol polyprotein [Trichonephila clavipes]